MTTPNLIDCGLFPPPPVWEPGTALITQGIYVFRCPVCARMFRYDDPYEPMCTGPGATDDHEPTVMAFSHRTAQDLIMMLTKPKE